MSLPVYVYTEDEYFLLKIRVLCERAGRTCHYVHKEDGKYPLLIWDIDKKGSREKAFPKREHGKLLLVSREDFAECVRLPIRNQSLLDFLSTEEADEALTLDDTGRVAYIYGEEVKLTELEGALLSYLISRSGECATNEELIAHLWGGEATPGVVNVYIHYLREKLELRGERVILVRRGKGYYIEPKFLGGGSLC